MLGNLIARNIQKFELQSSIAFHLHLISCLHSPLHKKKKKVKCEQLYTIMGNKIAIVFYSVYCRQELKFKI